MRKYISEFVGTLVLVLVACGVAVIIGCSTPSGIIATALTFGLVIVAMAYSIGNVSGCHINPAVSIAMTISGRMSVSECVKYIISQILGALAGSTILGLLLNNFHTLGANSYGNSLPNGTEVTWLIALIIEIILTFIFVLVILEVTSKKQNEHISGIIIGLTLTLVHLLGISFTGTSVNPARSLTPAILQGGKALSQVWIFIIAPIIGAVLASLFNKYVTKTK